MVNFSLLVYNIYMLYDDHVHAFVVIFSVAFGVCFFQPEGDIDVSLGLVFKWLDASVD